MTFQQPMHNGRFSIIIPNWNGQHHLPVCLDALRAQTYPDVEVIIADNASSDGSQAFIRANYPEVILLELSETINDLRASLGFGVTRPGFTSVSGWMMW